MPANPAITVYKNNTPVLDLVPKTDGNILFDDTKQVIFADTGDQRKQYSFREAKELLAIDKNGLVSNAGSQVSIQNLLDYLSSMLTDTPLSGRYQLKYIQYKMSSSDTNTALNPNCCYVFPEMANLTITFNPSGETYNEYHFIFTSGATPTNLTLPEDVKSDMAIEANRIYEVSVVDNLLTWGSWVK